MREALQRLDWQAHQSIVALLSLAETNDAGRCYIEGSALPHTEAEGIRHSRYGRWRWVRARLRPAWGGDARPQPRPPRSKLKSAHAKSTQGWLARRRWPRLSGDNSSQAVRQHGCSGCGVAGMGGVVFESGRRFGQFQTAMLAENPRMKVPF